MSKTIITDEQIAAINALAIGESLTLTDGRTVSCHEYSEVRDDCALCICQTDGLGCILECSSIERTDGQSVFFAVSEEA